jgi:hypothetical protein
MFTRNGALVSFGSENDDETVGIEDQLRAVLFSFSTKHRMTLIGRLFAPFHLKRSGSPFRVICRETALSGKWSLKHDV